MHGSAAWMDHRLEGGGRDLIHISNFRSLGVHCCRRVLRFSYFLDFFYWFPAAILYLAGARRNWRQAIGYV